jgi:hypothetical protein
LIVLDPTGTLLRVAGLTVLAGLVWAGFASLVIYFAARHLPPRVRYGRVWAEWRRKWPLWALTLLLCAGGAWFTGESLVREIALRDLYWITRRAEVVTIGRLGGLFGFLLGLFLAVLVGILGRRGTARW